jgi:hypothetical protein
MMATLKRTISRESAIFTSQMAKSFKVTARITLFKAKENSRQSMGHMCREYGKIMSLSKLRRIHNKNSQTNEINTFNVHVNICIFLQFENIR